MGFVPLKDPALNPPLMPSGAEHPAPGCASGSRINPLSFIAEEFRGFLANSEKNRTFG